MWEMPQYVAAGLGPQDSSWNRSCACCREHFNARVGRRLELSQEHYRDQRIEGGFDEPVVAVEALGFVVLGVDKQRSDSDDWAISRALNTKCLSGPPGRADGVAGVRPAKGSASSLNDSECLHMPVWRPRHDPPTKPHDLQSPTDDRTRSSNHQLTQSVGQNSGFGRYQSVDAAAIHERKARQIDHDGGAGDLYQRVSQATGGNDVQLVAERHDVNVGIGKVACGDAELGDHSKAISADGCWWQVARSRSATKCYAASSTVDTPISIAVTPRCRWLPDRGHFGPSLQHVGVGLGSTAAAVG
jgi:hypothetical protein